MDESTQRAETAAAAEQPVDLAYRSLLDHATECSRCAANWQECPTRRKLTSMLREARS